MRPRGTVGIARRVDRRGVGVGHRESWASGVDRVDRQGVRHRRPLSGFRVLFAGRPIAVQLPEDSLVANKLHRGASSDGASVAYQLLSLCVVFARD